jgi:hypothetical protein
MSVAEDIQALADLCHAGAHQLLGQILGLGPRPTDPPPAGLLWDQQHTRLQGQMDSMSALAQKLSSTAVLVALESIADDMKQLAAVSAEAEKKIAEIRSSSELLTKLSRVLDLGLAILAAAAAPSVTTGMAVAKSIAALAKDFGIEI